MQKYKKLPNPTIIYLAIFWYLCKDMLALRKIVVQNFRNIEFQELSFSSNVNCICGNNGEGKTNLMDAIYYLSMTKSAFSSSDRYNFRYGTDSFAIAGTYVMPDGMNSKFSVKVSSKGEKKFNRDDKTYVKISEHIGVLPIVMVSPSDISLVSDSGEERRRFANGVLSQLDHEYLSSVQQYNRLLAQRNKMLKDHVSDSDLLDAFDSRMSSCAGKIYESRKDFIDSLTPVVSGYYGILSGGNEQVSIGYRSDIEERPLSETLKACREKDFVFGYTTAGIQKDDFVFYMDGHPIRRIGSQGQQKSFLVSLKFAQYDIMKNGYGYPPVLLLDDVFDKLDLNRISNLLSMVAGSDFGQIFITDSNKIRMSGIVDGLTSDSAYFDTSGGVFTRI